ncbi:hypothetical protein, partial [Streptomyces caniscabiei]|uniref:hypothetical protein n=1 Tax=Streptomyces caniscabiei TaxID=2746961 RepID=UPI0038F77B32
MLAVSTMESLRDSAGQVGKDLKKEGVAVTRRQLRASDLPLGAVREYVLSASADSAKIVSENIKGFTIVKMGR